tara:strand:- start:1688 stop:2788 length:1101 start_codon:yes stop_codon:yes gene_type:complete
VNILITGTNGFLGKNLVTSLMRDKRFNIYTLSNKENFDELAPIQELDTIIHLAGVNRADTYSDFYSGNVELTEDLLNFFGAKKIFPNVIFSSTKHIDRGDHYGNSKKLAEELIENFCKKNSRIFSILRFPNLYGKWCRPHYNSVVATFCHNIALNKSIQIDDKDTILELLHVDDAVEEIRSLLSSDLSTIKKEFDHVDTCSIGDLASLIRSFKIQHSTSFIPDFSNQFLKKLYSTFITYLPLEKIIYELPTKQDERGFLSEIIKSNQAGQIFFSVTKPGITRGNHYHDQKMEKFILIKGEGLLEMRDIFSKELKTYQLSEKLLQVVDIPNGKTHKITNTGSDEMIVLFWANEIFDDSNPDTYHLEV